MAALATAGVMARTFHSAAAPPAPPLLAAAPRRATRPDARLEDADPRPADQPARPLSGSRQAETSPTRSSGPRSAASRPSAGRPRGDDRDASMPADLFARIYAGYERAKARAGRVDFEDMLALTVELLESDADAAAAWSAPGRPGSASTSTRTPTRCRSACSTLWPGGRATWRWWAIPTRRSTPSPAPRPITCSALPTDTRARASSGWRTTARRPRCSHWPIGLVPGRMATDERLPGVAPRPPKRLIASLATGPEPEIGGFATDEAELAGMTEAIRALARAGTAHGAIAILVRTNAQLPAIEAALGAAGIPFHVRGERFFSRPEVRRAMRVAATLARVESEEPLVARLSVAFERELGVRRDTVPQGEAAAERHGAVVTLLELAEDLARSNPAADVAAFLAEVERRAEVEAGGTATGVELLTYHRAKGLEWDAVFLPALEEGTLPIRQSTEPDELAEERRLLYVGITRARRYLWLSWATTRTAASGRGGRRSRSRFLDGLVPPSARRLAVAETPGTGRPANGARKSTRPTGLRSRTRSVPGVRPVPGPIRLSSFIVFHDLTIEAIAARRPRSIAELRRVPGVGPMKRIATEKRSSALWSAADNNGRPQGRPSVRWRLRSSLTHLGVRSLRCSRAAFGWTPLHAARHFQGALSTDLLAHERYVREAEQTTVIATSATTWGITSRRLWSKWSRVGICCAPCCAWPSDPGRSSCGLLRGSSRTAVTSEYNWPGSSRLMNCWVCASPIRSSMVEPVSGETVLAMMSRISFRRSSARTRSRIRSAPTWPPAERRRTAADRRPATSRRRRTLRSIDRTVSRTTSSVLGTIPSRKMPKPAMTPMTATRIRPR